MSCLHCGEIAKYKCPVCREPYCSVECCRKHKETPCTAPPTNQPTVIPEETISNNKEYEYPTEDTVPLEKLKLLVTSEGLKKCLENPHVRKIMEELDKCPHPDALYHEYMQEPIFTELVDECLKVVCPEDQEM